MKISATFYSLFKSSIFLPFDVIIPSSLNFFISLCIALYQKIKNYVLKSNDEKIAVAKQQVQEVILKLISDAEVDYNEWVKAGSIKRAQVIKKIFEDYPVLAKVADQTALVAWIDETIDNALKTLREIVAMNKEEAVEADVENAV